jgi:hypothetical protein
MRPIITDTQGGSRLIDRLVWFVSLWAASVTVLSGIAYVLHKIILG